MNGPVTPVKPLLDLTNQTSQVPPVDSPYTPGKKLSRVAGLFKKATEIPEELAIQLATVVLETQGSLEKDRGKIFPPSQTFSKGVIVTDKHVCVVEELRGKGADNAIFRARLLPTDPNDRQLTPGKVKDVAYREKLDKALTLLTVQSRNARNEKFAGKRGINPSYGNYLDETIGVSFSFENLVDGDFRKFVKECRTNFVLGIARYLRSISEGINNLHQQGFIHRDIKSLNTGFNRLEGSETDGKFIESKLLDFDLTRYPYFSQHRTTGTATHLDPEVFGDSLLQGKEREGIQTFASDDWAWGFTIYHDILVLSFNKYCELYPDHPKIQQIKDLLKQISPEVETGPFNQSKLKELSEKSNFRKVFVESRANNPKSPERVITYPNLNFLEESLLKICDLLSEWTEQEREFLRRTSNLCCRMQKKASERPSSEQVCEETRENLALLQIMTPTKKRRIPFKEEFEDCPSTPVIGTNFKPGAENSPTVIE